MSGLAGERITISFTPHLLPVSRGILSTIYVNMTRSLKIDDLLDVYGKFYRNEAFVRVYPKGMSPNLLSIRGTNYCDIGLSIDVRTQRAIIVSVIDNLVKGAAGQAIQNMKSDLRSAKTRVGNGSPVSLNRSGFSIPPPLNLHPFFYEWHRGKARRKYGVKVYTPQTRRKEQFEPIATGKVGIYVCGYGLRYLPSPAMPGPPLFLT